MYSAQQAAHATIGVSEVPIAIGSNVRSFLVVLVTVDWDAGLNPLWFILPTVMRKFNATKM